jgi:hypothetical protein
VNSLDFPRKMNYFSWKNDTGAQMQSTENKIVARIYGNGRGWVFSKIDFSDLGGLSTIGWSLSRLEKKGTICRVMRGMYYYPNVGTLIKEQLPVEIPRVAQALARKFKWKIEPSGETALNILGISTQVPAKYVYITNGRSKIYQIQKRELQFKKGMLKETSFKHAESSLLVQALRAYGKENLSTENLIKFRNAINPLKFSQIVKDTRSVTGWVYQAIQKICAEEAEWKR